MTSRHLFSTAAAAALLAACAPQTPQPAPAPANSASPAAGPAAPAQDDIGQRLARYRTVRLTTDLSKLTANERRMIPLLIDAAREMDAIFWMQTYGNRDSLLARITDPRVRQFVEVNYGPWDRLESDRPFVPGVGAKPEGANYYPAGMTRAEVL